VVNGAEGGRVEVDVGRDEVDWVSGLLWSVGVDAVEERDDPATGRTTLVTAPDSPELRSALGDRGTVRGLPADDTVHDRWREWARPVHVGRLTVEPVSGDMSQADPGRMSPEAAGGVVVVRVDPGRAFGHGAHPTTRAVLDQVVVRVRPGVTVLDVGCGSGVLAVAAAALGAGRVVAVDIDDEAVRATRRNAEANGAADRIAVSTTPVTGVDGRFDLVLANIGAATLVELAGPLVDRVAHQGTLVLSGLLADRRDEVMAAYPQVVVDTEVVDDGWCTLTFVRSDPNVSP
jgi:ribosomal protein L11 methyltransferase